MVRHVDNNPVNLRIMFQHHGNQFLKFHFLHFLTFEERAQMRETCKTIKQNIPKPQFSYFKTTYGDTRARLETNTGFVETCGHDDWQGNSEAAVSSELQSNVKNIFTTGGAFAALKTNGRVITWGNYAYGGDPYFYVRRLAPQFQDDHSDVGSYLQSGVKTIVSTTVAFAALKKNGKVISWGGPSRGHRAFSAVRSELQSNVKSIYSTIFAFAALKTNGRVITWGNMPYGGHTSDVKTEFLQNGVIQIETVNDRKFRATKSDGTQIEWPDYDAGQ